MISATHWRGESSSARNGMPGYFAMPIGVALTMPAGLRRSQPPVDDGTDLDAPDHAVDAASPRGVCARASSVSKTVSFSAPSLKSACATAAPAPPAPNCSTLLQRARRSCSREKLSAKPQLSVLWPTPSAVGEYHRVHRADRRGFGDSRVSSAITACLNGCVTLRPAKPRRCAASTISPSALSGSRSASKSIST